MSRIHSPTAVPWLVAALASLACSSASLATTGVDPDGPKSREQVQAELDSARSDGTLAAMRHNRSYPPQLDPAWHGSLQGQQAPLASNLHGTGEIDYAAPAAGVRSRDEVMTELQRSREDGSLNRMNSNRSY